MPLWAIERRIGKADRWGWGGVSVKGVGGVEIQQPAYPLFGMAWMMCEFPWWGTGGESIGHLGRQLTLDSNCHIQGGF